MSNLKLSLACGNYDRTLALRDGRVNPEGIDLNYIPLAPPELWLRMLKYEEFDISEMSLSNYIIERCRKNPRFVAIPVFPSRVFRHSSIFVNKKASIKIPQDLKGKKVGVPEYGMTALVWLRGILQHDYGVAPSDMEWYIGGQEEVGRKEFIEIKIPENVHLHHLPEGPTLNEMLARGEIDTLWTTRQPSCFRQKNPDVDRLWPNFKEVEMEYYKRTKIFPIMHTLIIKREIYEAHPWVAQSLYKAFSQAKKLCQKAMNNVGALPYMLPWSVAEYESTVSLMGEDFWPYGLEPNRVTLETATRYSYEQGLSSRKLSIDELFTPNTQ